MHRVAGQPAVSLRADALPAVDARLFRTFAVLAEELHFGRAARRLHLAQPAVSQQLRKLEAQLGVELFERTRHYVRLTPAGERALPFARQALAAAAAAHAGARQAAEHLPALLRVGLSPGVHYLAERAIAEFARRRPDVKVSATADSTGALARDLARGDLELALGFACAPSHGVRILELAREPAIAAIAESHPLARRPSVAMADLAPMTFALVDADDGPGYNDAVRGLCRRAGFEPRTVDQPSGPMAWETAVRSGGCVGLTSAISAASTLRGIRTVTLVDDARFGVQLLTPAGYDELAPPAAALARLAEELAGGRGRT